MSTNSKKQIHSDADLRTASDYLEYHIRMFVETLLWLREKSAQDAPKEIVWNAVLEDYLVHARLLIQFISSSRRVRSDDVIALDFFHDNLKGYAPLSDKDLDDWAGKIGGYLVHITTKPMPILKSHQTWPIDEIASRLAPGLEGFLHVVSDSRLVDGARNDCMNHLTRLHHSKIPLSTNVST